MDRHLLLKEELKKPRQKLPKTITCKFCGKQNRTYMKDIIERQICIDPKCAFKSLEEERQNDIN